MREAYVSSADNGVALCETHKFTKPGFFPTPQRSRVPEDYFCIPNGSDLRRPVLIFTSHFLYVLFVDYPRTVHSSATFTRCESRYASSVAVSAVVQVLERQRAQQAFELE